MLTSGKAESKIPDYGKVSRRPKSPGYVAREEGFEVDSNSDNEQFIGYNPDANALTKADEKIRKSQPSPLKIPKYTDRAHKKFMQSVKFDIGYIKLANERKFAAS